jgi:hypothetical protein
MIRLDRERREADLAPPAVGSALQRAAALTERTGGGWQVGGIRAGDDVRQVADALYAAWYTCSQRPVVQDRPPHDPPLYRSLLVPSLRAAHAGAVIDVSPLPVVSASPTGTVLVALPPRGASGSADQTLAESRRPAEYVAERAPGVPVAPGERVLACSRRDHLDADHGLWWCFSLEPPRAPFGRLYFDARPATAARVVHVVTEVLHQTGARYQLKCPSPAAAVDRVDAIVVYHERQQREELLAALTARADRLRRLLDPGVPPLTCPVLPGLAWADEEPPGEDRSGAAGAGLDRPGPDTLAARHSYGESRCLALASALHRTGAAWSGLTRSEQVGVLRDGLVASGINPVAPWQERTP